MCLTSKIIHGSIRISGKLFCITCHCKTQELQTTTICLLIFLSLGSLVSWAQLGSSFAGHICGDPCIYSYLGLDGPTWTHLLVWGVCSVSGCSLSEWCVSSHDLSSSRRLNSAYMQNEGLAVLRGHILLFIASSGTIQDYTGKATDSCGRNWKKRKKEIKRHFNPLQSTQLTTIFLVKWNDITEGRTV